MFKDLLESRVPRRRRSRVAAVSLAAHAVAITIAAAATARPPRHEAPRPVDRVIFNTPPAPHDPSTTDAGRTGRVSERSRDRVAPPTTVPVDLPPIDLAVGTVAPTIGAPSAPNDFAAAPRPGGPTSGAAPVAGPDGVYRVVERAAAPLPGAPEARYPEPLRAGGIGGEAVLRFVVDTSGRVEPGSVVVVRATHALFADAARRALVATRFAPAEAGGRAVRQLVEQGFAFTIR